jgi:succinoglycan biosynthesis transport protein ExoP
MYRKCPDEEGTHFLRMARVVSLRVPVVLLSTLLCGMTGAGVAALMTKQYKAATVIEVAGGEQLQVFEEGSEDGTGYRSASTRLAVMTGGETLRRAAQIIGGGEELLDSLRRGTTVRMVPNTSLLQVVARGTTPEGAAQAANAVVDAYAESFEAEETRRRTAEMEALRLEVARQREEVDSRTDKLRNLAEEGDISDLNPDADETLREAGDDAIVALESSAGRAKTEADACRALAERLGRMDDRQLFDVEATMGFGGGATAGLGGAIRETEAEISRVRGTGIGALHPRVRSLQAKLASHLGQAGRQAGAMRKALTTRAAAAEAAVAGMEEELQRMRGERGARQEVRSRYEAAKSNLLQAKKILQEAESRLFTGAIQSAMPRNMARVWERAEPESAWPTVDVMMAGLACLGAGLVLGVALAFFMDYLDTSARTVSDVEAVLDTSMLSVVPSGTRSLASGGWSAHDAEPYQLLRIAVEGSDGFRRGFSLAVTSGAAGEGKSTTAANLACAFAAGGYRVLLVDCDLRRPSQHRIFGVPNECGTSGIGRGEARVADTLVRGVRILPAGAGVSDPEAALSSGAMTEFLREAKGSHDIVILDSPPILGLGDAGILARAADRTLVVVRHRRFPADMLAKAKACLEAAGARIAGAVLNDTDIRHDENFDRYTGYYGYYATRAAASDCY